MPKQSIERIAIDIVKKYENKRRRKPREARKGSGYDIKSGKRCIEVKGKSGSSPPFVWLYKNLLTQLGKDVSNYYIYVVYNIKKEPKLKILDAAVIFNNLQIDPRYIIRAGVVSGLPDEKI